MRDPELVNAAARPLPGQGRGRDRRPRRQGRGRGLGGDSEADAVDIAQRFEDAGVAAIIYTDIDRDGALEGLNVEATVALAEAMARR